jgi:hypothetical protein
VDGEALSRLREHLTATCEPDSWFDLDPARLANELNWPEQRVRQAVNQLVKARFLAYKRHFKLGPGEDKA